MSREDPSISVKVDEETGQMLVSGQGELHLEILRDRVELEYDLKAELGPMRVAYRESISDAKEVELVLDKVIGGASMYAKIKILIESTIGDVDMTELQKRKFEGDDGQFEMSDSSFSLGQDTIEQSSDTLAGNIVTYDFMDLTPIQERVKLDGDEYATGNRR